MFTSSLFVVLFALCSLPVTIAIGPALVFRPPIVPLKPFAFDEQPAKPQNTPKANIPRKKTPPKDFCTDPVAQLIGVCDSTSTSTLSTNKRAITPLAKRATTTSASAATTTCKPTDSACNYCALAFSELAVCASLVNDADLDSSYIPDCLCYEATSDTDASAIWAPNFFDKAFASCPVFASTADKADLDDLKSATGLCGGYGDYYGVETTDDGSYVLAVETASSSVVSSGAATALSTARATASAGSGGASTGASASASTSTPTATSQSSGYRGLHEYIGLFQVSFAIALFMALF